MKITRVKNFKLRLTDYMIKEYKFKYINLDFSFHSVGTGTIFLHFFSYNIIINFEHKKAINKYKSLIRF